MSPSAALASNIFLFYVSVAVGLLVLAGAALAVLRWGLHKNVDQAWKSYRGWLIMVPLGLAAIFLGRGTALTVFTIIAMFGFKEFARASGLYRDWWMTGAVYAGIITVGIASLISHPRGEEPGTGWYGLFVAVPVFAIALILILSCAIVRRDSSRPLPSLWSDTSTSVGCSDI